jgi:kinesin family member 2/24
MSCVTECVARDVFRALENREFRGKGFSVHVSFLEIYGARCTDLLHDRNKVIIREDAKQRVVASGLAYVRCEDAASCLEAIKRGSAERTTCSTEVNQASSRSHSICEIALRGADGRVHGSIALIDLAGSERAADSRNHNRQRRIESAEINKSLLALKECIRALARRDIMGAEGHVHVPYRASKLTMVLKESFESENARVVMIATVSPNASSADHSQNTLRCVCVCVCVCVSANACV